MQKDPPRSVIAAADLIRTVIKSLQKIRIKTAALAIPDHGGSLVKRNCRFVYSLVGKGIHHIRNGYHLCPYGNLITFKMIRISLSIPPLMMITADFVGIMVEILFFVLGNQLQNLRSNSAAPCTVCVFIISNSSLVSFPGLLRIASLMDIFPTSCMMAARDISSICSSVNW